MNTVQSSKSSLKCFKCIFRSINISTSISINIKVSFLSHFGTAVTAAIMFFNSYRSY